MPKITNLSDINLPLAVWLLHDDYDYNGAENYISATSLMRPLKQIILQARIPPTQQVMDVADFIARALGHAIHSAIEAAWQDEAGRKRSLQLLGYPDEVIDQVKVNPTDEELRASNSIIPVYIEQRELKEFNGYTIGGKFDIVADGIVQDYKTTSAYAWVFGTRDEEHRLQGSIYKWLNPKKITADYMVVNYIFTDWSKAQARSNTDYPQKRVMSKELPLMTSEEVEQWVMTKLLMLQRYKDLPESQIPECSDEELWMSDPKYKYYTDPAKAAAGGRSTKNFDTKAEAHAHLASKGVGVVKEIPGEPKRCGFCNSFEVCKQKDRYFS